MQKYSYKLPYNSIKLTFELGLADKAEGLT